MTKGNLGNGRRFHSPRLRLHFDGVFQRQSTCVSVSNKTGQKRDETKPFFPHPILQIPLSQKAYILLLSSSEPTVRQKGPKIKLKRSIVWQSVHRCLITDTESLASASAVSHPPPPPPPPAAYTPLTFHASVQNTLQYHWVYGRFHYGCYNSWLCPKSMIAIQNIVLVFIVVIDMIATPETEGKVRDPRSSFHHLKYWSYDN